MESQQEHHAQQAPEVVGATHYPEALAQNHYQQYALGQPAAVKPGHGVVPGSHLSWGTPYSTYGGSQFDHGSPPSLYARPAAGFGAETDDGYDHGRKKKSGMILGCTTLVFVLCVAIAILAAAVVGLAAGTGVEAHRADAAEARADQYQASASRAAVTVTVTSSAPTSTSFADIDDNCSGNPEGVTGTTYKAFSGMSSLKLSPDRCHPFSVSFLVANLAKQPQ